MVSDYLCIYISVSRFFSFNLGHICFIFIDTPYVVWHTRSNIYKKFCAWEILKVVSICWLTDCSAGSGQKKCNQDPSRGGEWGGRGGCSTNGKLLFLFFFSSWVACEHVIAPSEFRLVKIIWIVLWEGSQSIFNILLHSYLYGSVLVQKMEH